MDKTFSRTNPLVSGGGVGEDTCLNVGFVLSFLRDAFLQSASTGEAFNENAMVGAANIIDCCRDALRWADEDGALSEDPAASVLKQV